MESPANGFLTGIHGNPPKLRLFPNLLWQVANVRSQPAKASKGTPNASPGSTAESVMVSPEWLVIMRGTPATRR